ncbi:unnamed protein product [Ixodes pacificus]
MLVTTPDELVCKQGLHTLLLVFSCRTQANTNEAVRDKVLELVQAWAHAFRNDPNYRAVQDTLNLMKVEGHKFPQLKESDAMFSADQAPDWADGECCHRCRVQFTLVQRKHHCRNCGQIFCQKCSSQMAPIPRFGIEKEVRVCEACYEKLSAAAAKAAPAKAAQKGSGSEHSSPSQTSSSAPSGGKSEQELQEEEELQLAIALSKSEVETNQRASRTWQPASTAPSAVATVPNTTSGDSGSDKARKKDLADGDPELARYLNRAYWEQRQQQQQTEQNGDPSLASRLSPVPSAPTSAGSPYSTVKAIEASARPTESDSQLEEFVAQLRTTLEVFVNRLQSNAARGRPVANDSHVQNLFLSVSSMHTQLVQHLQHQEDLREYYEGLQDKLAQIRDARGALDALREEHREQLRRDAEEAERQRQIQMAQKLHIMRQKKQEYLQYQHQLALQRMQEQERELQMRHELQKQQLQYHHINTTAPGFPGQPGSLPPQIVSMAGQPGSLPPNSIPHHPGAVPPQPGQMHPQMHPQQGQMPSQQGHMPPQQGQMPPQQGQMPPQQGQMPPQQGQMPPQQGQMHTQQGQVHPQQAPLTIHSHQVPMPQPGQVPQGTHPQQGQVVHPGQPGTMHPQPGQVVHPGQGLPPGTMLPQQGQMHQGPLPAGMRLPQGHAPPPPQQQPGPMMQRGPMPQQMGSMAGVPGPYRSPTHAAGMPYMMPPQNMVGGPQYGSMTLPHMLPHPMEFQAYALQCE